MVLSRLLNGGEPWVCYCSLQGPYDRPVTTSRSCTSIADITSNNDHFDVGSVSLCLLCLPLSLLRSYTNISNPLTSIKPSPMPYNGTAAAIPAAVVRNRCSLYALRNLLYPRPRFGLKSFLPVLYFQVFQ